MASTVASQVQMHSSSEKSGTPNKSSRRQRLERAKKTGRVGRGRGGTRSSAVRPDDRRSPNTSPERGASGIDIRNRARERFRHRGISAAKSGDNVSPKSPVSIVQFDPSVMNDEAYLKQITSPKKAKDDDGSHERSYKPVSPTSAFDFDASVPFDEQLDDVLRQQKPKESHGRRDDEQRLSELKFDLASLSICDFMAHDDPDLHSLTYSEDGSESTPSV